MAMLEIETGCNRISASSQTNYPEYQKILYARAGNKTFAQGKEKKFEVIRSGLGKFCTDGLRNTARGMFRENFDVKAGKYLSVGCKKNWMDDAFDNFQKALRGNERFGHCKDKKQEQTRSLKKPKRQNLSKSQEEDLFQEHPQKSSKKQQVDFSMHKTFYDIFPNINKKANSLSLP